MTIFIAEDHQLMIDAYKSILPFSDVLEENIVYIEAKSCEVAYTQITEATQQNVKIDLAILDYSMPPFKEKNIANGGDICQYLQEQQPDCKTLIVTSIIENIKLFEVLLNVKPDAIVTKPDIDGDKLLEIIALVLAGEKYKSDFVNQQINEIWESETFVSDLNRRILNFLALGYKLKQIAEELSVSEITIKKRISKIKQSLDLKDDTTILKEAKLRGYI